MRIPSAGTRTRRSHRDGLRIVVGTLTILCTLSCRRVPKPEVAVDQLSALPHGLTRIGLKEEQILADMRRRPDRYLPVLRSRVVLPPDLRPFTMEDRQRQFFGATTLLFALGDSSALALADTIHQSIVRRLSAEWHQLRAAERGAAQSPSPTSRFLHRVQNVFIDEFARVGSRKAVAEALELLRVADYATAMNALQYLAQVAPGDAPGAAAAEAAIRDPRSALVGDPIATRIVQNLLARAGRSPP